MARPSAVIRLVNSRSGSGRAAATGDRDVLADPPSVRVRPAVSGCRGAGLRRSTAGAVRRARRRDAPGRRAAKVGPAHRLERAGDGHGPGRLIRRGPAPAELNERSPRPARTNRRWLARGLSFDDPVRGTVSPPDTRSPLLTVPVPLQASAGTGNRDNRRLPPRAAAGRHRLTRGQTWQYAQSLRKNSTPSIR
jgi:hypothetical protein